MKIGIDVSQTAFSETGVANFTLKLVENLLKQDKKNEYILFYSSLRKQFPISSFKFLGNNPRVRIKKFKLPPIFLDFLWNKLHVLPMETFIGNVDVFISSDWTQPPSKTKKATILYDLIIYKYPQETDAKIINVQKRKLAWVKKEVDKIICISESTKQDAKEILGIEDKKLVVIYPGI